MRPPAGVNFDGVLDQVPEDLLDAGGIGPDVVDLGPQRQRNLQLLGLDLGLADLQGGP